MESIRVLYILLVTVLPNNVLSLLAVQSKVPQTTISYDNQQSRSSKEIKSNSNVQELDGISSELKTTGHKWLSDEYHIFSSLLTSPKDISAVNNSPVTTKIDTYPMLTTDSPPFITRNRYVRNPYANTQRGHCQEMHMINGHPQYLTGNNHNNIMNAVPKRNRLGQRHLKTYGPLIVKTDSPSDSGGNVGTRYNSYDNAADYSTHGNNYYEAENYYKIHNNIGMDGENSNGDSVVSGNGMSTWYNDRPAQVKSQNPSPKIRVNMKNLGILAAIKIAMAKIKVIAALKLLALIIIKLKLIAIFTFFLFFKFTVISKLFKFFLVSFLPDIFTWLRNAMTMQPMIQSDSTNSQFRNMSTVDSVNQRSTDINHGYVSIGQFIAALKSEKCLEKMACHAAEAKTSVFQYVLLNCIILSSLIKYNIPNKKLKLYISTFKDVSDYRLKNIFSNPSTEEWLTWYEDRYSCEENAKIEESKF